MVQITPEFEKAQKESRQLVSKPNTDDLLELYALFKVGNGEDITKAEKPGMFDMKGKYKQTAWQKLVDEGVTPEQAQERYVKKVEAMKETYGFDANKEPEAVASRS
ncbi:putative fatty acid binding protein [Biscogniauxia mediterranea]|nr:putative fatty acid binding protein [Biscogniauxia sp. FL1348]KAI1491661.1 putative fatty acid binding protein [Biscogniauxia mediterranea]KAI1641243.1 putative fatty acid binding protein [Biscogniauxia mediterranea]